MRCNRQGTEYTAHTQCTMIPIMAMLPALPRLLHEPAWLSGRIVSFACRDPSAAILKAFDISNTRNIVKTIIAVALLGLYKNVPLPPPPLFSGSSVSCNLLQISGFIHSNVHFCQLVHFCVTPCVPIQQGW